MGSPRGYNALHDLYTQAQETPDWAAFRFSTSEGDLVSPEEIEAVKATLDPTTYAQEFDASFEQSTSRVYLMFSREHNVRSDLREYDNELLIGLDFNVGAMAAVVAVKVGDQCHVMDELTLSNSNTQQMSEVLRQKYPGRSLTIFPDPSGNSRKTSATSGETDHTILRQAGFRVVAPRAAAPVVDRVNVVNALLMNAKGQRRLFVHPRCKQLINGLERLPYREGTSQPNKSLGLDHHTDALGYLAMMEFPITNRIGYALIRGF